MNLTNTNFVYFCQNLLGAPFWFNASAIKATKNAYKINSIRFPEEYKKDPKVYEQAITENEVVTDAIGLIKGYAWSNGGKEILENRGNPIVHSYKIGENGCPDKSVNGMFVWATEQNIKWGEIDTLPNVPGLVLTYHGYLGIYEGNGFVIEADKEKGYVTRESIQNKPWRFWYQLPFIEYEEEVIEKPLENPEELKSIELQGIAIANQDVLFREGKSEDSKLLKIIKAGQEVLTYNDSNYKLLHIFFEDEEGYTPTSYFTYFPKKPNVISPSTPTNYTKKYKGVYIVSQNVGIRSKPKISANSYATLSNGTEVIATGNHTDDYLQVYVENNNKIYVGYINKKYLKRVAYIEK